MAHLNFTEAATADLDRLAAFLYEIDPTQSEMAAVRIAQALELLRHHPLIGRLIRGGPRELVISRGKSGYLALYRYDEVHDEVLVLSIRHQRETGYRDPQDPEH